MFQVGTASSIADLFSQLNTFAASAGWTVDHSASDRLFLTRTVGGVTCSVAFLWSTSSPTCAAIYQHTAFISSGTAPGSHTNDSGQGFVGTITNANLLTGRNVFLANSAMSYWFFEDDSLSPASHIYVVATTAPDQYAHFGFGSLIKLGTWTGGAFAYGHRHVTDQLNTGGSYLLDGLTGITADTTHRPFVATLHCESLPNQTASGKWGVVWGGTLANTGTDRGATARESIQGGFRAGPIAENQGRYGGAPGIGIVPGYPIGAWYDDRAQARLHPLGYMPNVVGFNVKNYAGGEEITVGSDIWIPFPARFKSSTASNSSGNLGMAYKKVTT